ncbi:uncharacterized protein EV422DRAFT_516326 [Fimicolochytrium jonesii]|uniref:uncharacterized protein n=1 Tax=Fimicolochytrium jonesii TaxID=1396493 RepID=UPI0022FF38B8|nr:uncharacterized protein EV422DRAFT_516326 [Fimicolochytrium jonesii]KAI8824825.1 hypothetical protein EV422DRAFT_516326 [Fimicolochytrium jonesii]
MGKRTHDQVTVSVNGEDGPSSKKIKATDSAPVTKPTNGSAPATITKDEADLYDRQIRLWGLEAQQRMRQSRILVAGVTGTSNEILKNLVLSGVGALTIQESESVEEEDLGAQFFLREEDVGENRAEAVAPRAQALNPRVHVKAITTPLANVPDSFFTEFDIVCLCNATLSQLKRADKICRKNGVKFYAADTNGITGFIFCDLREHNYVEERKTTQKDETTITRLEKSITFPSLEEALSIDWATSDLQKLKKKELKHFRARADPVFFAFNALWQFRERFQRPPRADDAADVKGFITVAREGMERVHCDPAFLEEDFLKSFIAQTGSEISPVCAIIGGFAAQDILKVLSGKDAPIDNFFCFDGELFKGKMIRVAASAAEVPVGKAAGESATTGGEEVFELLD